MKDKNFNNFVVIIFFSLFVMIISNYTYAYKRIVVEGTDIELWWDKEKFPLEYHVYNKGCYDIDDNSDIQAIKDSMKSWASTDCSIVDFKLIESNTLEKPGFDTDSNSTNKNIIYFENENWTMNSAEHDLIITALFYNTNTGEIYDADIIVNDIGYNFSTNGDKEKHDLHNTLSHGFGHILGMDHVEDPESIMFSTSEIGETKKRVLNENDKNGICEIYPVNNEQPQDNDSQANDNNKDDDTGCSCSILEE